MQPKKNLVTRWNKFWFKESSGRPEALFRIAFSTILLFDILGFRDRLDFFFSNQELHIPSILDPLYSSFTIHILYVFWIFTLLFLIAGFFTRISAVLNLFFVIYFIGCRHEVISHATDWIMQPMAFYLALMESGARLSLDKKYRRNPQKSFSVWPVRLAQIHLAVMYFTAGLFKIIDPEWINGHALRETLMNPILSYFDFGWLEPHKFLLVFINYAIIAWELTFPAQLIFKKIRRRALIIAVIFHVLIAFAIRVEWFSEYFLASLLLFIDDLGIKKWESKKYSILAPRMQIPFIYGFLCFHFIALFWGETKYFFTKKIPIVSQYANWVIGIEPLDVWPGSFLLKPIRFLYIEALRQDGSARPLPPFNLNGEFAPGIQLVKEAREGFIMIRIAHGIRLTEKQWEVYAAHLVWLYQKTYGPECPKQIRIYRINANLEEFGDRPKAFHVPKKLIAVADITCKENRVQEIKVLLESEKDFPG